MKLLAVSRWVLAITLVTAGTLAQAPPREWIDEATGHRVIRLSPDEGGASLYFHQNTYTPHGDKLVFDTKAGIAVVDVTKFGNEPVRAQIVVPEARAISVAWRTPDVYYRKAAESPAGSQRRDSGTLCATNVETKKRAS